MRLIKDHDLKEIYRDKNGVLYQVIDERIDYSKKDTKAIIYTNGSQLDHYQTDGSEMGLSTFFANNILHAKNRLKTSTLATIMGGNKAFGHDCDWYDDDHLPYVFKYIVSKDNDGVEQFSISLKKSLLQLEREAILLGKSYGGVICSYAYEAPNVMKIIAVNPSFLGSPLSNPKLMGKFKLYPPYLVSSLAAKLIVEPKRQFTWENARGIEIPETSKLIVVGGSIKGIKANKNEALMKIGYSTIHYLTGMESDGIVIWDVNEYLKRGASAVLTERPFHSNTQTSEYMKEVYSKTIKR